MQIKRKFKKSKRFTDNELTVFLLSLMITLPSILFYAGVITKNIVIKNIPDWWPTSFFWSILIGAIMALLFIGAKILLTEYRPEKLSKEQLDIVNFAKESISNNTFEFGSNTKAFNCFEKDRMVFTVDDTKVSVMYRFNSFFENVEVFVEKSGVIKDASHLVSATLTNLCVDLHNKEVKQIEKKEHEAIKKEEDSVKEMISGSSKKIKLKQQMNKEFAKNK